MSLQDSSLSTPLAWRRLQCAGNNLVIRTIIVATAYFAAARVGLIMAVGHSNVTPEWPASGIALVAALLMGPRAWPGIWIGQFLANLLALRASGQSMLLPRCVEISAVVAISGIVEAGLGAALVRRYAGENFLSRGRSAFQFLMLAGPLSCAAAASIGVFVMYVGGAVAWPQFSASWLMWWTGDVVGILTIAPALLAWIQESPAQVPRGSLGEAIGLAAFLALCVLGSSGCIPLGFLKQYPLIILYVPGLVCAAIRFGPRGAAVAVLLLSAAALFGMLHHLGPFAGGDSEAFLAPQLRVGVVAFMGVLLAAVVTEREAARTALLALNQELEERIQTRTAELESANAHLRSEIAERGRAEEALHREKNRLSAVLAVQNAVAASAPDLDAVLRMIAQRARTLVDADSASIGFAEGDAVVCRVSTNASHERPDNCVPLDNSLSGQSLRTGQVILCNDTDADTRTNAAACRRNDARSLILVPLHQEGRPTALLSVHSSQPEAFTDCDVTALQLLAGFLESVLSHAAAFEEKRAMLTDKTAALEELRETQDRFVAFMDNSPAIGFMKDSTGRGVYHNAGFRQRLIPHGQEWIGKTNFDMFEPEIAAQLEEHDRAVLRSGQVTEFIESTPNREGRLIHWLVHKFPIRDSAGRLYLAGQAVDITERLEAERSVRESRQRLKSALAASHTGTYFWNARTDVLDADEELLRLFDCKPNELATLDQWLSRIHPEDRENVARHAQAGLRVGHVFDMDYRILLPDGQERWLHGRGEAGFDADGNPEYVSGACADITSRKTAERLDRERASLCDAVRAMEQVLSVVGHELRTPLAALRALSEFLLTDGARATDVSERFLRDISEEVDRMSDTVNNILEAARLNSGKARWNWGEVDLAEVCNDAVETLRPLIDPDRVNLLLNLDVADRVILGDGGAIRRLLINLLSNARKHTPAGTIEVAVRDVEEDATRWIEMTVTDTGGGMPPEILSRVGEAFALNAGVVGACHVGGTGLGVAIVKGIAAAHGGQVRFDSEPGKGTSVCVLLRPDLDGPCQAVSSGPSELIGTAAAAPGLAEYAADLAI